MSEMMPRAATGLDGIAEQLQSVIEGANAALLDLSQRLDQTLGAEVTTALSVVLGLASLALALLPVYLAWRKPKVSMADAVSSAENNLLRSDTGEEVVKMHPECLQTLYGLPPVPVAAPEAPVPSPTPVVSDQAVVPEPSLRPDNRQDVSLGLMADLSEALSRQQQIVDKLTLLTAQQQRKIDSLVAQMKAQSSAFLLQGERLLRLESQAESANAGTAVVEEDEEVLRLSTFDQAIELADKRSEGKKRTKDNKVNDEPHNQGTNKPESLRK